MGNLMNSMYKGDRELSQKLIKHSPNLQQASYKKMVEGRNTHQTNINYNMGHTIKAFRVILLPSCSRRELTKIFTKELTFERTGGKVQENKTWWFKSCRLVVGRCREHL